MELIINHRSVCEGGPTHLTVPDGATTIGQVIALFKKQTGITHRIRLRAGPRELRSTDTLDEAGIAGGDVLTAVKNTSGSATYQALCRVELGISRQSRAHGELMAQVGAVGTAVSGGFQRVEERLERALAHVAPEQSGDATPREQLTFLQNRRATDLNRIRLIRDSVRRGRDEASEETEARPKAKAKAQPKASRPEVPVCNFVLTRGPRKRPTLLQARLQTP